MKLSNKWYIQSLFIFIWPLFLASQDMDFQLEKGKVNKQKLKPEEAHNYRIDLNADQFLLIEVMQEGIDIIIKVYDPAGKEIGTFDSPNGTQGPELIQFDSNKKGTYRIELKALQEDADRGNYTIKVLKNQKSAITPEGKVDQLFTAWDREGSPGAAVAIVKDNKITYSKGYGYAQLEYDVPITPATIFHIASISKQFTAFAITMLADQGKLNLDDDIRKYLPEVPDFGKLITIRHLIYHTSGLRDQWNLLALAGWRLDDVITKEHILKLISNQKELNFDPGAEFLYCNTGYTLLAEIVHRITGMSFADWCKGNIFDPLGMVNTLFYDDHEKIVKNRAYSYASGPGGFRKSVLSYANVGATSLFTTVEDLARWAINFDTKEVFGEKVLDQTLQRGILNNGDTLNYAFGQGIGNYKGLKLISHGGADAGYRTFLARFPEQDFAVIVFSNLGSFNPGGLGFQIADIYLSDRFQVNEDNSDADSAQTDDDEVESAAYRVDQSILDNYVGKYEIQAGFILEITTEDGKLFGQATGQPKVEMEAKTDSAFVIAIANAEILFNKNSREEVFQLTLLQGGGTIQCQKIKPFDPNGIDLEIYIGNYYSEELQTAYELLVEDGKLIARHQRHPDIELTGTKEDFFSGNRWFFGQVEFVRDEEGILKQMKVSNGRVRNLVFDKFE